MTNGNSRKSSIIERIGLKEKIGLAGVGLILVICSFFITRLKFTFDFEQFFPVGDKDYAFFKDFIKDFEADDNFMLVGIRAEKNNVFDTLFLKKIDAFTTDAGNSPFVTKSISLTNVSLPIKSPFGYSAIPVLHFDDASYLPQDSSRIMNDERFLHNLISGDGKTLAVVLKTKEKMDLNEAKDLMESLNGLVKKHDLKNVHFLGRAFFQQELVEMEKREVLVSTLIAAFLVGLIMFFIFRRVWGALLAILGIGLSLIVFLGVLGMMGRELSALAALYPLLMAIVGTADTIHIMSKYIDELNKGQDRKSAIRITIKEIGFATFLTCTTTAIGFASLLSNKVAPIRDFGINCAIGVVLAFFTILFFLWVTLPIFRVEELVKPTKQYLFWDRFMDWIYQFTRRSPRKIVFYSLLIAIFCGIGISKIHTNYKITSTLPIGYKVTEDFLFFEKNFAGFRPLEYAVFPGNGRDVHDLEVLKSMDLLEGELRQNPNVKTTSSLATVYKTVNQMNGNGLSSAYTLPDSSEQSENMRPLVEKINRASGSVLISKDGTKGRITSRLLDIGADSVLDFGNKMDAWVSKNIDSDVATFKRTGTGVILDKNALYVRDNMLQGLIPSVLIVALIMAFLYKDFRLILIFLVPNLYPLLFAGAMIGFTGVALDAGISVVFSIIFGIAVDDTIHFLSTFRICRGRGMRVEEAIETTLKETGKAMCLTSIILFFAFLVLLFSAHPPSVTIGLLISVTLVSALFCDLFMAPVLIRWLIKDKT
jgi:uncharacterized protein